MLSTRTVTVPVGALRSAYTPFVLVCVPAFEPTTVTCAPTTGSPVLESVTRPVITDCCAATVPALSARTVATARDRKRLIPLIIETSLWMVWLADYRRQAGRVARLTRRRE